MEYAIRIVEQSGRELTDYQVKVEITDPDFFSKCTDQKFVEFYDEDKQTLLPHYTELFDTANKKAIFWVKVPSIPANGTKMIYLNINTERTEDLSDGEATFDFFDDFEGNSLDTSKWTVRDSATVSVANSIATVKGTSDSEFGHLACLQAFSYGQIYEIKAKVDSDSGYYNIGLDDRAMTGSYQGSDIDIAGIPGPKVYGLVYRNVREGATSTASRALTVDVWRIYTIIWLSDKVIHRLDYGADEQTITSNVPQDDMSFIFWVRGNGKTVYVDWVRVRKYTDPEPSVTVIRLGATPTYDLKLKIAQALAGETTTILDTDPKIRLLSGTDIIKELSLTAKTVYKDATNNRVVVAFLFVDDSSDEYTADNLELLFTKDNTEYIAFKSSKSFTKVADKRLPLRWEIYLYYDVDVCTYEETMIDCL